MEQAKALPWAAVWDELCQRDEVPVGAAWLKDVTRYEEKILAERR
jgi:L-rhamnose isomerase